MLSITRAERKAHSVPTDTWSPANDYTLMNSEETLLLGLKALKSSAICDCRKCRIIGQRTAGASDIN
jgi:hypothetical protein